MQNSSKGQDSLGLFDFGVLLQALSNNLKVGVLAVRSGKREKFLHLDRTSLECIYTARPKVSLRKVLYNHRTVERTVLRQAAAELGAFPDEHVLAQWLVENAGVTPEQIRRAHAYQMVEEVLELFYWENVGFEFHGGDAPAVLDRVDAGELRVVGQPQATDNVLIQCTKIIDDIAKFDSVTPSLRDVYELHFGSLDELARAVPDRGQREFMLLIDGIRDMREILQDMRMNRFEVLELFYRYRNEGRIRPKNAFELLMLAENRRKEFSLEKRARVLERVNELGVEGFGVVLPLAETYEALGRSAKAAECYRRHALLSAREGHVDAALESTVHAAELAPDDPEVRRLEIDLLVGAGRLKEAAHAYKALAEIHRAQGDLAAARATLEQAVRLSERDPVVLRRLGEVLAEAGDARGAALRSRMAGDALLAAGEAASAAACFERALTLWPRAWNTHFRLARALHAAQRSDVAVQTLADVVRLATGETARVKGEAAVRLVARVEEMLREVGGLMSSATVQVGAAYRALGRPDDAARILSDSADALMTAKRYRTACEIHAELVELRPDDVSVRRRYARCHAALGDRNRALAQLRRGAARLTRAERWQDASDVFREMLEVDPASLAAHIGLAQALLNSGGHIEASEHFHRAGLLHRACGRAQEALPFFAEAVEKRPNDALLLAEYSELLHSSGADPQVSLRVLTALVELRLAQGEPARAATALTRILEIDPNCPGVAQLLAHAADELRRRADAAAATARRTTGEHAVVAPAES